MSFFKISFGVLLFFSLLQPALAEQAKSLEWPPSESEFSGLKARATYYVRTDGKDQNSGLEDNAAGAWRTLTHALSMLKPGDHLLVGDGTYHQEPLRLEGVHGSPEVVTKITASNRWKALLTEVTTPDRSTNVLSIADSSYVVVEGFDVSDPIDKGNGIDVQKGSHHVIIRDCNIHDCGCGGITLRNSDYLLVEGNVLWGNAKRSEWNGSGISLWHPVEHDQKPGYHCIVRKNVCFDNECNIPFRPHGFETPTDGNGIIIDDFLNTQGGGQKGGYHAEVLVENNLCFDNGGRGVTVYHSSRAMVRNNTCYHNLRILSKYSDFSGEIMVSSSAGCRLYNNLAVQNPAFSTKAIRLFKVDPAKMIVSHNFFVGTKDFGGHGVEEHSNQYHDKHHQDYAALANPKTDISFTAISDFRKYFAPRKNSPVIKGGTNSEAPSDDLDGVIRSAGDSVDIGCYEKQGTTEGT